MKDIKQARQGDVFLVRIESVPSTAAPRERLPRYGEPQKLTCHNAVASTFGLIGEEYAPEVET